MGEELGSQFPNESCLTDQPIFSLLWMLTGKYQTLLQACKWRRRRRDKEIEVAAARASSASLIWPSSTS